MKEYIKHFENRFSIFFVLIFFTYHLICISQENRNINYLKESKKEYDERIKWWIESRFGLFIHWGLYSICGGEYNGNTGHAEWLRYTARIPLKEYDKFLEQFNPTKFNAEEWVKLAKDAGMKYIVITTKHHDGFCLFDSKYTDFDIMATPFKRDIMKEIADACRKYGIKIGWYYSITDWHHQDYIPYLEWETDRDSEKADFQRYVQYVKNQLKELLTNYGEISILWFDGGNEKWNSIIGKDIYNFVKNIQPKVIINNRLAPNSFMDSGFMEGEENFADFGTPEQTVPSTGIPNVNWESCITMNNFWGYNKNDPNWKSGKELIHLLTDIVSKGGNLLLNIGPTGEGLFPSKSIERLKLLHKWMRINCESIYQTSASPFKNFKYGRCTQRFYNNKTRLYLHIFNWPKDGKLYVNAISNKAEKSFLLSDPKRKPLKIVREEDALVISVPKEAPDTINSVIVLDINGKPIIAESPFIFDEINSFVNKLNVPVGIEDPGIEIRYTIDGSIPSIKSPTIDASIIEIEKGKKIKKGLVTITEAGTLSVRGFKNNIPITGTIQSNFYKVKPLPSIEISNLKNGLIYKYYEGDWNNLPEFDKIVENKKGITSNFGIIDKNKKEYFGYDFQGFINIPEDDVYLFYLESDDGSKLYIDNSLLIDNDGLHPSTEKSQQIALAKGFHSIRVIFFQRAGGMNLKVFFRTSSINKQEIPNELLFYQEK